MRCPRLALLLFFALTASLLAQTNSVPFVSQPLVPSSVAPGTPVLTLTVNGTGFVPGSVVNWNGSQLSTAVVNSRELIAAVPGALLATPRTASVTVTNPVPGGGTSNLVPLTITIPTKSVAFTTTTIPVGSNPSSLVAASFTQDGVTDLAVVSEDQPCYPWVGELGTISVLLGDGGGGFSNRSTLCFSEEREVGGYVYLRPPLLAGNFSSNGNVDLVSLWNVSGLVEMYTFTGNGDGTFEVAGSNGWFDGVSPSMIAGDFNRDGNLDVAILPDILDYSSVFVFLGNGDGTFTCCGGYNEYLRGQSLAAGDFNNDGILDLAVINTVATNSGTSGTVTILLGNGDGTFTLNETQPSTTLVSPASAIAADFNGDGNLDLAIADMGSTALTILRGNGDGTFTQVSGEPALPQPPDVLATADLNGDGDLDLVIGGGNTVSVLLGNGDGTFTANLVEAMDVAPNGLTVADFNGDGRLDIAAANPSDNTVSILQQAPARRGATLTAVSGQNPVSVNQSVTYTAVVWATPTQPTGSVTFKQGATILGTVALTGAQANFTTTFPKKGTFSVVASYSGDQNYPATSTAVKQVVSDYISYADLSSSLSPSLYGQAVTLTCDVSNGAQNDQPTGTVTFTEDGAILLGKVQLANGQATLTRSNLPSGTLSIKAAYNGDSLNSKTTSSALIQVVSQATSTTTVTSSKNPSLAGHNVTFKAAVMSPTVTPVGSVTFAAGTAFLGTVGLKGGKASLTTFLLPAGTTTITATYNGTPNISASSGSVVQTVN